MFRLETIRVNSMFGLEIIRVFCGVPFVKVTAEKDMVAFFIERKEQQRLETTEDVGLIYTVLRTVVVFMVVALKFRCIVVLLCVCVRYVYGCQLFVFQLHLRCC